MAREKKPGEARRDARRRAQNRAPATMQTRVRIYNADESEPSAAAWYANVSKMTEDQQRTAFAMYADGHEPSAIAKVVNHPAALVESLLQRGVISPRRVDAYRCQGCRNKVVTVPCFICETKRIHANSRKLREVNA